MESVTLSQASGLPGDLGQSLGLAADNVRLVQFEITSVYEGSNDLHLAGLDQVRFVGTTVPEPSTMALLVSGLLGMVGYAWRKRK